MTTAWLARLGRAPAATLAAVVLVGLAVAPAGADSPQAAPESRPNAPSPAPSVDVRGRMSAGRLPNPSVMAARAALADSIGPSAVVQTDRYRGAIRWIVNLDGTLTDASSEPPRDVALGFLRDHRLAFGLTLRDLDLLRLRADYRDILGTHHLSWVQRLNGVRIFGAGLKASVAADGSLVAVAGPVYHVVRGAASALPRLSRIQALAAARGGRPTYGGATGARDSASLTRFPEAGMTTLAWDTITVISPQEVDRSVIDARTGAVLWRENLMRADQVGSGLAWPYAPGSYPNGGGSQASVTFPVQDATALSGNNAHVYTSVSADDDIDPRDEIEASDASTLTWDYAAMLDTTTVSQNCSDAYPCTWDLATPYSWELNRAQAAVQAYFLLNRFHDHLEAAPIGFTEAAGNLQLVNDDAEGGAGGDPLLAQTLVAADLFGDGRPRLVNNASMYTPRDGQAGRMYLFLFRKDENDPSFPSGDAADDASVIFHEYTHALSSRLVTMPDGSDALNGDQAGALGEGWSDWYALDALVADDYQPDRAAVDLPVGAWITGGAGIRFQYADCLVTSSAQDCPAPAGTAGHGGFTYGDFGHIARQAEVHSDGEIWLQTLWQLRSELGSPVTETLVTRAMELSPQDPSFLDMRDAILVADTMAFDGSNHGRVWQVFAERGMGFFASTGGTNDTHPRESFSMPVSCPGDQSCGSLRGRVMDPTSHRPVAGALVRIAGGENGLPLDMSATTSPGGWFHIDDVPSGPYRRVEVAMNGYRTRVLHHETVNGDTQLRILLPRDWASLTGGATIVRWTGPNHTETGGECGPRAVVDGSLATSWLTRIDSPQSITVRLPQAIHVQRFAVDPSAICAGAFSNTKAFDILTRREHGPWVLAYRNRRQLPSGHLTVLRPRAGAWGVRYVRLVLRSASRSRSQVEFTELVVKGAA